MHERPRPDLWGTTVIKDKVTGTDTTAQLAAERSHAKPVAVSVD